MPLFKVDIEKLLGQEYWTNRYIVNATDLQEGDDIGASIVAAEQEFHLTDVLFTKRRTSTLAPGGEFTTTNINLPGNRAGSGTFLPLFNTLRVDLSVFGSRPSRKYYRGVLTEGDISGDGVTTNFTPLLTLLLNVIADEASTGEGVVDVDGQLITSVGVYPRVQMRQLRRGRRRRTTPVLP